MDACHVERLRFQDLKDYFGFEPYASTTPKYAKLCVSNRMNYFVGSDDWPSVASKKVK
jgi:hypothetical protein